MASYASGSVRVPGLSGNDTDFVGMIKKLRDIESRQVTQLGRWKSDWKTRLNAFKELRGELMNLQTTLNELNSMNKFLAKATVSSEEKVATAVADADSINSSYKIEVNQKARGATWTKDTGLYTKTDVICEETGYFEYFYKGKIRRVNVPKNTTVEGLTKLINNDSKNPGVRAEMIQGADGITFQLRGMDTGKSNTLVIRETKNIKGLDTIPGLADMGNYDVEENSFTFNTKTFSAGESVNDTGSAKSFIYTVDGTRRVVEVTDGMTIEQLTAKINELTPGVGRLDETSPGQFTFALKKDNTTYTPGADPDDPGYPSSTKYDELMGMRFGSETDKVISSGSAYEVMFQIEASDGSKAVTHKIEVDEDMSFRDVANALQAKIGKGGKVTIVEGETAGTYKLQIEMEDKTHRVTVEDGTLTELSYTPPSDPGWDVKHAENGKVKINDYPSGKDDWLEVASNTLKSGEVMPGITFYIHSTGTTEISVSTDTNTIKENIQKFVDAINSFRTKLKELTEYDENKEVLDLEFAESQFEMQKGGILQGNYGVQTIASRLKNAVAGNAMGFNKRELDDDGAVLFGDIFTSLSQIGIKTNANTGEANYGLLEINYVANSQGSKSLDQALADDPEAVARLFSISNVGESHSDQFHYKSHVHSITKPGTYSISYKIDDTGNIIDAYINGQPASPDQETGTITATSGSAKGLTIDVADRTPGTVVDNHKLSIKSGKVQEILGLLEGSEGILGSKGTLKNLEKNYQKIIDNIDKKILKENDRLERWERTMVLKFARLEGVLANYDAMQKNLESQLAQLGNNKK